MVENVARQHSAISDIAMAKGADEEFVNVQDELLAKCILYTFILVEEYGSGGVGIPEGRDFCCVGSDGNISFWIRIQRKDEHCGRQIVVDGGRISELQEAKGSIVEVLVNRRSV